MKNKPSLFAIVLIVTLTAMALYQFSRNQNLVSQLDQDSNLRTQLLQQVEFNTEQRLLFERQIENLETNLLAATNQITNLSDALQEARENADPNLQQMREEIKADIEQELRDDPRQLTRLIQGDITPEQIEASALINVRTSYDDFLNLLDADNDRLTRIEDALLEVLRERSVAALGGSQVAGTLSENGSVYSLDYMLEHLSSVLTPEEQELFAEYESELPERQRRNSYNTQILLIAPDLNESSRGKLADLMMDNISSPFNATNADPLGNYVERQLEGLNTIEQLVESEFAESEYREVMNFISQQKASMEMVRAMGASERNN